MNWEAVLEGAAEPILIVGNPPSQARRLLQPPHRVLDPVDAEAARHEVGANAAPALIGKAFTQVRCGAPGAGDVLSSLAAIAKRLPLLDF